ncbi:MAG: hypothetical protein RBU23_04060 [Candidatus Auribacterota bacterium]|nr:hypothetical protein [Candidatus Auribacterota bacterium]
MFVYIDSARTQIKRLDATADGNPRLVCLKMMHTRLCINTLPEQYGGKGEVHRERDVSIFS